MEGDLTESHALWAQARRQLSDYELRTSELNLDLQHALRSVQSARDILACTTKEINAGRTSKKQIEASELLEMKAIQVLQVARDAEVQDTQRLVQQLGMARQKLMAIQIEAEAERKEWETHIAEQLAHNQKLEVLLQTPLNAEA